MSKHLGNDREEKGRARLFWSLGSSSIMSLIDSVDVVPEKVEGERGMNLK